MLAGLSLKTSSTTCALVLSIETRMGEPGSVEVDALGEEVDPAAEELARAGEAVSTCERDDRLCEGESLSLRRSENRRSGLDDGEPDGLGLACWAADLGDGPADA